MTLEPERDNDNEKEILDSGVHVRDSERSAASVMQITVAAVAIVAILSLFFWGVNHQSEQIAGSEATQATTAASGDTGGGTQPLPTSQSEKQDAQKAANQQEGKTAPQSNAPATTGQGGNRPAAPPPPDNAPPANQQPTGGASQGNSNNVTPAQGNEPAQPRGAGK
jgi:hypothetical protein